MLGSAPAQQLRSSRVNRGPRATAVVRCAGSGCDDQPRLNELLGQPRRSFSFKRTRIVRFRGVRTYRSESVGGLSHFVAEEYALVPQKQSSVGHHRVRPGSALTAIGLFQASPWAEVLLGRLD